MIYIYLIGSDLQYWIQRVFK